MNNDSRLQVMQALDQWRELGWLRSIDFALVELLHQTGETRAEVLLLAALVSHQVGRGHTVVNIAKLVDNPSRTLNIPPDGAVWTSESFVTPEQLCQHVKLEQQLASLGEALSIDSVGNGNEPLVLMNQQLFLRRYWHYEDFIQHNVAARIEHRPVIADEVLKESLALLFQPQEGQQPDKDINWQRVACANTVKNRFSVITGGPGTGKTYTVVRLLVALQYQALKKGVPTERISLAAPTGKAAARLTESINKELSQLKVDPKLTKLKPAMQAIVGEGMTLHRLLGVIPNSRRFKHHQDNPLRTDIVIVDEASMVDIEMMVALLKAVPPHARLVLIGDKDQLASVEAGAVLGNLCDGVDNGGYHQQTADWLQRVADTPAFPAELINDNAPNRLQNVVKFRKSYRFKGPIADLANAINQQNRAAIQQAAKDADTASIDADYPVKLLSVPSLEAAEFRQLVLDNQPTIKASDYDSFDAYAIALLKANTDCQLLTALREGPWGLNAVNARVGAILGVNADTWFDGRPVMVTKNDYGLRLNNGDIGIALRDPDSKQLRVAFADSEQGVRWVLPSRLTHIETVYAMTVHKSQGSEFKHTVMVLPDSDSPVMTKELLYTGITRAKDRLTVVGNQCARLLSTISDKH